MCNRNFWRARDSELCLPLRFPLDDGDDGQLLLELCFDITLAGMRTVTARYSLYR
jgi:hypothetical protein